eukprot:s2651_g4.t3
MTDDGESLTRHRHVRWQDLRGSGSDCSLDTDGQRAVSHHHIKKDADDGLVGKKPAECCCGEGVGKLLELMLGSPSKMKMSASFVPGDKPIRIRGKLTGHMWKLNNNVEPTAQNLSQISSWRRRLFLIEDGEGALSPDAMPLSSFSYWTVEPLRYLSEKEDGLMVPAAMLRGRKKGTKSIARLQKIEALPETVLDPVDDDMTYSTMNNIKQYEIAFFGGQGLNVKTLPEKLYPMRLRWTDGAGKEQQIMVAAPEDVSRKAWMVVIRTSAGMGMAGHAVV